MMTEFADIDGGRIAYDVTGQGPLVVLSHGIGDRRQAYRFLAPRLAQAGYRVANADLRGHGESSMGWPSVTGKQAISRTDVAGDLLALIRNLGGPAVIAGQSISGGAATIAAATEPELVGGIRSSSRRSPRSPRRRTSARRPATWGHPRDLEQHRGRRPRPHHLPHSRRRLRAWLRRGIGGAGVQPGP